MHAGETLLYMLVCAAVQFAFACASRSVLVNTATTETSHRAVFQDFVLLRLFISILINILFLMRITVDRNEISVIICCSNVFCISDGFYKYIILNQQ